MMKITEKAYEVDFDERGTLTIRGKLAEMPEEYEKIEAVFEKMLDAVSEAGTEELTLDLRYLRFLNSSGIKTLCVSLVMEADDIEGLHMKILASDAFTWQVETLPTFKDLMDNLEIVFE